ncbi:MAG: hypothetical protein HOE90_00470 [Bacteriovoracaceae bacterium]|jgi:hypothetical protein|nr:hypothetical protein [Bacteriovoracaceae bacterium]
MRKNQRSLLAFVPVGDPLGDSIWQRFIVQTMDFIKRNFNTPTWRTAQKNVAVDSWSDLFPTPKTRTRNRLIDYLDPVVLSKR